MEKETKNIDLAEYTNTISNLHEHIARVSHTTKQTRDMFDALAKILNVDGEKLLEALIIRALTDLRDGKECTYEGNLYHDTLTLILELKKKLADCEKGLAATKESNKQLWEARKDSDRKLVIAASRLLDPVSVPLHLDKKRYSPSEVMTFINEAADEFKALKNDAYEILIGVKK